VGLWIGWPCCLKGKGSRMAANYDITPTVRAALSNAGAVREVKMFGGIGFLLNGNLVAAASRRGLLARVGKGNQDEALARPEARPMVMRGRTMEGYVYVDHPNLTDSAVRALLKLALAFVQTLPRKAPGAKSVRTKGKRK
jgi:TfoX/Sxy family transcriptional regulator of competence genes